MAVGLLQFVRNALIAVAYEKVPMETFGQDSVFRAASSLIVHASIRLPTTNRPLARTSRHFIVGVPSGNEITPCAADNSAVAGRLASIEIVGEAVYRDSSGLRALSSLPVRVVRKWP
jgi:hypothetical protein